MSCSRMMAWVVALLAFFVPAPVRSQSPANGTPAASSAPVSDEACASCHDVGQKVKASGHANVKCQQCHAKHEEYPHPAGVPKAECSQCHAQVVSQFDTSAHARELRKKNPAAPDCAVCHGSAHEISATSSAAARKAIPDNCGGCHSEVVAQFQASVHGKAAARGMAEAPVCTDCHGAHAILSPKEKASSVNAVNIRETCASCHGDVRLSARAGLDSTKVSSFDESFHGLSLRNGEKSVANCASCHGVHNILPSTDAKSTIHEANLSATCGQCHPGAGTKFAIGTVHVVESKNAPIAVQYARWIYLILIPLTVGLMALHHGGDYIRKLVRMRLQPIEKAALATPKPVAEFRMYGFERVQHGLLMVSFIALVWTGFALKYPGAWWGQPLTYEIAGVQIRGSLHRIAAVIMVVVSVMHVVSLIASRKLRHHWLDLLPKWSDVTQGMGVFLYNLGLKKTKPAVSAHGYIEKVEYWAVVWGTAVMAVTGFALWFNDFSLRWIPKSWLDFATTVHFYEGVLATLAIVVWHFYMVIFDPEVYPMDPAWLTGNSVRKREHHEPEPSTGGESSEGLAHRVPAGD
jgi:cytochrome b subunit of formate dehydrogenase